MPEILKLEKSYMYLLQRKEEASISYISALPNIKILSIGFLTNALFLQKSNYIPSCFFTWSFNTFWYFLFIKMLDTKINTRDDLEKV